MKRLKHPNTVPASTLEDLGLGRISPFVKLGIDTMDGEWHDLRGSIEELVEEIDHDGLGKAAKTPPLGIFQGLLETMPEPETTLSPVRLSIFLKEFNGLIGRSGGPTGESGFDSLRRVFGTVNLLHETFSDYRQYGRQAAGSTNSDLQL